MKKLFTYVIMLYASLSVSVAQQIQYPEPVLNPESCTSIMVGKKASADGSVMTSHTCDSNYRTWMDIVPSASYDHDTTTTVYTGRMHTEYAEGTRGMIAKGTLPEARSTYQFREAVGYRRDNDHRPESPCQQERYVHDRGTSANRLATLHDRP